MSSDPAISTDQPPWYQKLLRCPQCCANLCSGSPLECTDCGFLVVGKRDLRPQQSRTRSIEFRTIPTVGASISLDEIDTTAPGLDYSGPPAQRDSRELMTEVSARLPGRGRVLDLGCGPRDQAACFAFLGFDYVGVDYSADAADLLADAHALPFADASFECVFSYAVLEHLHNPYLALAEIARVLRPGGCYIGTVSQGEPFHSSYFHHTAWGMAALIESNDQLELLRLWPANDTLESLATMGRYPRVIRAMLSWVEFLHARLPWLAPRRMRWGAKEKQLDSLGRAGAICFTVRRRADPVGDDR